jgi:hypothetical protein
VADLPVATNAVILNRRHADRLGWRADFDRIVALLAPDGAGEWAFARAVARWQAANGLAPNGILGPSSWDQMRPQLDAGDGTAPPAGPSAPLPLSASAPSPGGGDDDDGPEEEFGPSSATARRLERPWVHCPPPAGVSAADWTVLALTTHLGAGRPFACTVSPTDGITVGPARWNLRDGTLQALLARFEDRTGRLRAYFRDDYDRLMRVVALRRTPEERDDAVAQATAGRLAERWGVPLLRLFSDPVFYGMAKRDVGARLATARGAAKRLGLSTVRGLALLFEIATADGLDPAKVERFGARLRRVGSSRALTEAEALVEVADESVPRGARGQDGRWARRMVIAKGSGMARGRRWDLRRHYRHLDEPWGP